MQDQLRKRVSELKSEFETGQKKLEDLESQANNLRSLLLRMSGAIQVLEEELGKVEPPDGTGNKLSFDKKQSG